MLFYLFQYSELLNVFIITYYNDILIYGAVLQYYHYIRLCTLYFSVATTDMCFNLISFRLVLVLRLGGYTLYIHMLQRYYRHILQTYVQLVHLYYSFYLAYISNHVVQLFMHFCIAIPLHIKCNYFIAHNKCNKCLKMRDFLENVCLIVIRALHSVKDDSSIGCY